MTQDDQQRLDELEIKTSFQEQLITDLNDELVKHGELITALQRDMAQLVDVLRTHGLDSLELNQGDERPPHY